MYRPTFADDEFRCDSWHYLIPGLRRKTVIYTYIRKNGCTAFKRLIGRRHTLRQRITDLFGDRTINTDRVSHIAKQKINPLNFDFKNEHRTVFVYRDPFDRAVSTYVNKFVNRHGAGDISENFHALMGRDPESATFLDFLDYLEVDFPLVDCHCWPQKAHLLEHPYTDAIELSGLKTKMAQIIGPALATKYFSSKVNASGEPNKAFAHCTKTVPAKELRQMVSVDQLRLGRRNFDAPDTRSRIQSRYHHDYSMIAAITDIQ